MPVHDLFCPTCGEERRNTRLGKAVDGIPDGTLGGDAEGIDEPDTIVRSGLLWPLHCGAPMDYYPSRTTGFSAYDVNAGFDVVVEDVRSPTGQRTERVSSITDIRRIEKESEQRYANGEGRPFRWRDLSQDKSNRDVNTFGEREKVVIPESARKNIRKGKQVADDHA